MLSDRRQLETYIIKCAPPFSWDNEPDVDFFRLIGLIWEHFDKYKPHIEKFIDETALDDTLRMVDNEFGDLMSSERRQLIRKCLQLRHWKLVEKIKRVKQ